MQVVLDTNIIVSALLQPLGPSAAVYLLAISGKVKLVLTRPILDEYEEVIKRPRLKRDKEVIKNTLESIQKVGFWVKPERTLQVSPDPDDNMFLECAEASEADYLVTGNTRHFPKVWKTTKIVTAQEFLASVAKQVIDESNK